MQAAECQLSNDLQQLTLAELEAVVVEIEKEKEQEAQKLRDRRAATAASQAAMMGRATGESAQPGGLGGGDGGSMS